MFPPTAIPLLFPEHVVLTITAWIKHRKLLSHSLNWLPGQQGYHHILYTSPGLEITDLGLDPTTFGDQMSNKAQGSISTNYVIIQEQTSLNMSGML